MKRRFTGLLGVLLAICMIGSICYGDDNETGTTMLQSSDDVREGTSLAGAGSQTITELVVETVTYGLDNPGLSLVEEAVNQITEPAIGVRIRLLDIGIGQHAQQIGQQIANGEQIDLVMAGLTYPMVEMAADGLLLSLEELVEIHAPSLREIFGDKMKAGYLGDVLYAIPAKVHDVSASGILYNQDMAWAAGVTVPNPCTLEELDGIMAAVREAFPEVYGTAYISREVSLLNFLYSMETYGSGSYAYGVTYEPWKSMEIENAYTSEQYLAFCKRTRSWQEQGLLPPNLMTSSVLPGDRLAAGQIFCLITGYAPGEDPGELGGQRTALTRLTEPMSITGLIEERMWAVPVTSAEPDKALEFLELLYTTPELANLLTNGIEGIHYTRVSDHIIAHADGPDYQRIFTIFGDQREVDQWIPATEESVMEEEAFENSAKVSLTLGYTFDARPVQREVEAVHRVIALYAPALECGLVEDVEGAIALFNQELEAAGIDRVIAENQSQLSIWLSEQGH